MNDRAQLVLVAAAVAALALVPVAAAYLQFGYAPNHASVDDDHDSRVTRALDRLVDDAAESATGEGWSRRDAAVQQFRAELEPRLGPVERARLGDGVVVNVTYNASLAATVDCPSGPAGSFGACDDRGGVVVQERAGETVVVAVAFDVQVTTPTGTTRFSRVVRPQ